jgi:hypothetical protein
VEHVASPTPWLEALHDDLFIDHLQALDPHTSRQRIAKAYHNRPDKEANLLAPLELQLDWLREIGYTDVDCVLKIFELAVFTGRR